MVTKNVAVYITGDAKSLDDALAGSAAKADATAGAIGDSFGGATSKTGSAFERLGQKLENWGVPFGSSVSKVGEKLSEAETKGQKFGQAMSTLGGAVLGGAVVGVVAFGAESIEMADKFDVAQANLRTAVEATGANFDKLKPKLDASYQSMSNLGFNSIDTSNALTQLTTSTGSPTQAMKLLGSAADLARFKHISLASASTLLGKAMAGSTRVLTQMGINLDIGSGKLSAIHTATEAVSAAQLKLKQTQEEVASGVIKAGVPAQIALTNAQNAVSKASQKLQLDQGTVGKVIDEITKKTHGAAQAYGQTLAGQMDVAKAKVENISVAFGERLIPMLESGGRAVAKIIDWFEKHKTVAEGLAVVIGAVLGAAVLKFSVETAGKMVGATKNMANSLLHLGDTFGAAAGAADEDQASQDVLAERTELLSQQVKLLSAQLNLQKRASGSATDATIEATAAALDQAKGALKASESTQRQVASMQKLADTAPDVDESLTTIQERLEQVQASCDGVTEGMGEVTAASPELDAAFEETGAAADSAFGPIGLIIMGVVTVGTLLVTHWKQVESVLKDIWGAIKTAAVTVWDWLKDHLKVIAETILVVVTGPIGLLVLELVKHWNTVKSDAVAAWHDIVSFFEGIPGDIVSAIDDLGTDIENVAKDAWNDFKDAVVAGWNDEVSFWEGLPGKIVSALGDAGSLLLGWGKDLVSGIVNGVEDAASAIGSAIEKVISGGINSAKSALNSIPVIGGAFQAIGLATGGYVTKPTLALVGEAGPEFVIPEAKLKAQYSAGIKPLAGNLPTGSNSGVGGTFGAGTTAPAAGGAQQIINIQAITNATAADIAHEVSWTMRTAPV